VYKIKDFYKKIRMTDMVEENGKIWISLLGLNGLVEIDIHTWKTKVLCRFEEKNDLSFNLYNSIAKIDKKIIVIPCTADRIAVYDLNSKKIHYIEIDNVQDNRNEVYDSNAKFWKYYIDGKNIYLMGHYYPAIVKINVNNYEVHYITDWVKELDKHIKKGDKRGYIGAGFFKRKRNIYLPLQCYPAFLILDLDTNKTKIKKIDSILDGIGIIGGDNENIWLEGKGDALGCFVKLDIDLGNIKEIGNVEKPSIEAYSIPFLEIIDCENRIILFPSTASFIYEIEKSSDVIKKSELNQLLIENGTAKPNVLMTKKINNKIYFITSCDRKLHTYFIDENRIESRDLYLPEEYVMEEIQRIYTQRNTEQRTVDEREVPLNFYITRDVNNVDMYQNIKIGKNIYAYTRKGGTGVR
jgi:hypothetical protein